LGGYKLLVGRVNSPHTQTTFQALNEDNVKIVRIWYEGLTNKIHTQTAEQHENHKTSIYRLEIARIGAKHLYNGLESFALDPKVTKSVSVRKSEILP